MFASSFQVQSNRINEFWCMKCVKYCFRQNLSEQKKDSLESNVAEKNCFSLESRAGVLCRLIEYFGNREKAFHTHTFKIYT